MAPFTKIDRATPDQARALLSSCCGSRAWVDRMLERRPFGSDAVLMAEARERWRTLSREDWLEAFRHHPKIGDRTALAAKFPATRHLAAREQAGVSDAPDAVLDALEAGNRAYEQRFGYIFIVCATGKTADEMLALMRARLTNQPDAEIRIAAEEQAKITALRLWGL